MARPASWIATRPDAGPRLTADLLTRVWGIAGEVADLPSERDRNVLVHPDGGGPPLVLKISNLVEDPAFLACQETAMIRLAAAGVPVARSVSALEGRTLVDLGDPGPPWARVLTYLPGRPLATVDDPSDALLADVGTTMGRTVTALLGFEHPAARRELQWDVQRARDVIAGALPEIDDPGQRARLARVLSTVEGHLVPALSTLRTSVIHNDANDHNILVDKAGERVVGLLDFGDMLWTATAHEAAVALAYAMFHRAEPLSVVRPIVGAFDRAYRLDEAELDALPSLVLARIGASVAIAARQGRLDPDPYLRVSESPAWETLERLEDAGPEAFHGAVHEAVGR